MQLAKPGPLPLSSDLELIAARLPVRGARLLELGCGAAETTRRIAESLPVAEIVATEVDRVQHAKNLALGDLPRVRFVLGGAERIALEDGAVDAVVMLKSLHHVPVELLDRALREIHRVLRPGGLAYISEPVYAGAFNDILKLFNDERAVRAAAFEALRRAVEGGLFELEEELFFDIQSRFQDFAEFEQRVLGATHSEFAIDAALHARIEAAFSEHARADGSAEFRNPHRLDLLRKPAAP